MTSASLAFDGKERMSAPRITAMFVVIVGHCLLVAAVSRLSPGTVARLLASPLEVQILPPQVEREELPPPKPVPVQVEIEVPPLPDFTFDEPPPERAITVSAVPRAAPPVAAAAHVPLEVTDVDYLRAPRPSYPSMSRRLGQEGTVVLRALVDARGSATDVQIHRSSGYRYLDEAGVDAVRRALFKPYVENGIARAIVVLIPIEFGLSRHASRSSDRRVAGAGEVESARP